MKGDFTRSTFRATKHYSSVRMQQGRLQLDSDWNEQVDIQLHFLQTQTRDVVGGSGVPVPATGLSRSFLLEPIEQSLDLKIVPGSVYVGGILCELEPSSSLSFPVINQAQNSEAKVGNAENKEAQTIQVPTLLLDGHNLAKNQWIEIYTDSKSPLLVQITDVDPTPRQSGFTLTLSKPSPQSGKLRRVTTVTTQPDYPGNPLEGLSDDQYTAYLDVWQRHITTIEDPSLREVALNLPDTTTRTQTIWQIKLVPTAKWDSVIQERTALLKARSNATSNGANSNSFRRLENQLYRVEIHTPSEAGTATFKWSRDNGAIVSAIDTIETDNGNYLTVPNPGRDVSQSFAPNQWVEITDDPSELLGRPGVLVRLTAETAGTKLVFPKSDRDKLSRFSQANNPKANNPKVRRWDHTTIAPEIPIEVNKWIPLEDGIEVWFEPGSTYQTGDYWLIPARTVPNDIEWLRDDAGNPLPQPIEGTLHSFCPLAQLTITEGQVTQIQDLRPIFPPLVRCLDKTGDTFTGLLNVQGAIAISEGQDPAQPFRFQITQAQRSLLYVSSQGNVGMGTKQPAATLHLQAPNTQPALQINQAARTLDLNLDNRDRVHFQTSCQSYSFDRSLITPALSSPDNTDLSLRTASNAHLTILHTNGNVGIGIEQPVAKLHIAAAADQPSTLHISQEQRTLDLGLTADDRVQFQTSCQGYSFDKSIAAAGMTVDRLTVANLAVTELAVETNILTNIIDSPADKNLLLKAAGTTQIVLARDTGNIGLGTETAIAKLQIATPETQPHAVRINRGDRALDTLIQDQQIQFQTTCQRYQFDKSLDVTGDLTLSGNLTSNQFLTTAIDTPTNTNLILKTAGTPQLTLLQTNGNVGIGTETPETKFHLVAAATQPTVLRIQHGDRQVDIGAQDDNHLHFQTNCQGYWLDQPLVVNTIVAPPEQNWSVQTSGTPQITVLRDSGNVGIGTVTPTVKLQVDGDVKISGNIEYKGGSLVGSSRELKENITELSSAEVAELLQQLNPVKFVRKADSNKKLHAGFIAEEVPHLVASADHKAISPMEIIAILTRSVKDHEQTIDELTQLVESQQQAVTQLLDRLRVLEGRKPTNRSRKSGMLRGFSAVLQRLKNQIFG